ncbi:MAG: amidohydrolase family protein [Egibacteraceae bacterium]
MTTLHVRARVLPDGVTRDLFVVEGRFATAPAGEVSTILDGGFVVPGLVDAHAHLGLASPAPGLAERETARANAREHLRSGVLAIREPGGPNRASVGIGPHEGLPRTFTAGRFLAAPGRYVPGFAREVTDADLPDAAEDEARASGGWTKVIGDWFDGEGRLAPSFAPAALADAAASVHAGGGRIAVHATLPEVIEAAIEAGADSIEHGSLLQPDHIPAMAARGIALVPTLMIRHVLSPPTLAAMGVPADEVERLVEGLGRQPGRVRAAAAAGVVVLAGTDAGIGPHGLVREEVRELLAAGLPPEQALAAASWEARRFLGLPGIADGAPADLVAYPDDPRGDPDVLARPTLIMLAGQVVETGGATGRRP